MPAIFLTEDHVRELLDMPTAIEVVRELFRELAIGRAKNVPRQRVQGGKLLLHTMSGVCEYLGIGGWKAYSTTREKSRFHVGLYDLASGELLALIEADFLGQLRTGAASGVATEFLARPDAKHVGLFGARVDAMHLWSLHPRVPKWSMGGYGQLGTLTDLRTHGWRVLVAWECGLSGPAHHPVSNVIEVCARFIRGGEDTYVIEGSWFTGREAAIK